MLKTKNKIEKEMLRGLTIHLILMPKQKWEIISLIS